jgi:hypothetical protein
VPCALDCSHAGQRARGHGETLVPGGSQLPAAGGVAPFAALLACLVGSALIPAVVPALAPSPPWAGWDHPGARAWPDRDDRGRDLNEVPGPARVDDAICRVRERLNVSTAPACIGHGDWESQNIRWAGGQPVAVHDRDSVIAQPEPAIAGLAAAVWPAGGGPGRGPGRLGGRPVGPPVHRQEGRG